MKGSFPGEEGGDFIPKLPDPPPLGQCPHWVSVHLQFRACITASQLSLGRRVPAAGGPRPRRAHLSASTTGMGSPFTATTVAAAVTWLLGHFELVQQS